MKAREGICFIILFLFGIVACEDVLRIDASELPEGKLKSYSITPQTQSKALFSHSCNREAAPNGGNVCVLRVIDSSHIHTS